MSKIILSDVAAGYNLQKINDNFDKLADVINNDVLFRRNPTGEPNSMVGSDLDMDSNRILNLPAPLSPNEPARLQDLEDVAAGKFLAENITFSPTANIHSTDVQHALEEVDTNWRTGVDGVKAYADSGDASTLAAAKQYADTGDANTLASAKAYTDTAVLNTVPADGSVTDAKIAPGSKLDNRITGIIDVRDFGAVGDGVVNDTAAIQAAINYSISKGRSDYWGRYFTPVYFPSGTYLVSGISFAEPLTLYGDGPHAVVLDLANGANTSLITYTVPTVPDQDTFRQSASIRGMTLNCNGTGQTGTSHGINLPDSPNNISTRYDGSINLKDVIIRAAKNHNIFAGMNRNNGSMISVQSVYAGGDGAMIRGFDWRIDSSDFGNATGAGIRFDNGGAHSVTGTYLYTNGDAGAVLIGNYAPINFSTCYFDTNAHHGLYAEGFNLDYVYHVVTGSTFRDNGTQAYNTFAHVYFKNMKHGIVRDNTYVVNQTSVRPAYILYLDNTPSASFSGIADLVNATTKPFGTAVCNAPQNIVDPSYIVPNWIAYTPTVSAGSGSITSASATGQYRKIGSVVHWEANVTVADNGTGATWLGLSLPFAVAAGNSFFGIGRNATTGGADLVEFVPSTSLAVIRKFDDTYPAASGQTIAVSGTYQTAS